MDNTFEILKLEDYKSYIPLDIAAVHISEPGSMGYHGVLRIITSDRRLLMVRYLDDQWPEEDIIRVCPVFRALNSNLLLDCLVDRWKFFYMGFGNHLYAKEELAEKINFDGLAPHEIYRVWIDTVLDII